MSADLILRPAAAPEDIAQYLAACGGKPFFEPVLAVPAGLYRTTQPGRFITAPGFAQSAALPWYQPCEG